MELLAPAGSMEALKAAVENGADAVYLGGQLFNARQSANNFSIQEIAEAVKYAHLRGVKIYITVNILLADSEFSQVVQYIRELMECQVDALIIQDLGLLYVLKEVFPDMPVHASTQMTIHNSYGAKWFYNEGMERVVLSRELSLDEIKHIARVTPVELETFAHGALCISYSGQCLFSSMIGGRSGNRGRCAQPCRMSYNLVDEHSKNLLKEGVGEHLLSPKDLNTSEILPQLDGAGIASLKIEGRMKRPEYVATVIRVYRAALNRVINGDNFEVSKQEKKDLAQIFNRDFTTGYFLFNTGRNLMSYKKPNNRGIFLGRIVKLNRDSLQLKLDEDLRLGDGVEIWVTKGGREGFTVQNLEVDGERCSQATNGDTVSIDYKGNAKVGDRVFKTADIRLQTLAKESYSTGSNRKIAIDASIELLLNKPIKITLKDEDDNVIHAEGVVPVQLAIKTPTTKEMLMQQVNRIGNTAFFIENWDFNIDDGVMLPVSEINAVRREAVAKLEEVRLNKFIRYDITTYEAPEKQLSQLSGKLVKDIEGKKSTKLSISVSDYLGFKAALAAQPDIIYVAGEQFRKNKLFTKENLKKVSELAKESNIDVVFSLPRIWHDHEMKYLSERMKIVSDVGIQAFQVSTPAGMLFVRECQPEAQIYTDMYFNTFNSYALKYLTDNNIKLATLSPELTLNQLRRIKGIKAYGEAVVFGALPVMVSEHCMLGSLLGERTEDSKCSFSCKDGKYFLQDRMKFKFPIHTDMACRMHIYNSKVLNLLPNLEEILGIAPHAIRLDLRLEQPEVVGEVSKIFAAALKSFNKGVTINAEMQQEKLLKYFPQGFTKGHYFRGILDTED